MRAIDRYLLFIASLFFIALPSLVHANGAYGLLGLGMQAITEHDVNDAFTVPGFNKPDFSGTVLGKFDATGGWQFSFPLALEAQIETFGGRDEWETFTSGANSAKFEINESAGSTVFVNTGASLCLTQQRKFWFLRSAVHQFGVKIGYVTTSGDFHFTDNTGDSGTISYSGGDFGWGTYYRLRGIVVGNHFTLGAELGYEGLKIPDLEESSTSGFYAGESGRFNNKSTGYIYRDNSGPYLKLIVGMSDLWDRKSHARDESDDDE